MGIGGLPDSIPITFSKMWREKGRTVPRVGRGSGQNRGRTEGGEGGKKKKKGGDG